MALVPFPGAQSGATARKLPEEDDDVPGGQMSFLEHLDELRRRIVYSLAGVGVGLIFGFLWLGRIGTFLLEPTYSVLPAGRHMIYTQPGEAFSFNIQIALIAGVVFAAPVIMYQVWLFVAPGLYQKEKKLAIPFVALSTIGFLTGALFNHYVVFKFMMRFFASFDTNELVFMPRLEDVFDLYTKMLLGMGVVFQMPTIVLFLAKMQLVTWRFLARHFKYAVLIIFIVAAIITPSPDAVTQTLFAAPMIGLYLVGIAIAWIVGPKA